MARSALLCFRNRAMGSGDGKRRTTTVARQRGKPVSVASTRRLQRLPTHQHTRKSTKHHEKTSIPQRVCMGRAGVYYSCLYTRILAHLCADTCATCNRNC